MLSAELSSSKEEVSSLRELVSRSEFFCVRPNEKLMTSRLIDDSPLNLRPPLVVFLERYLLELRLLDELFRLDADKRLFDNFDDMKSVMDDIIPLMENCLIEMTWVRDIAMRYHHAMRSHSSVQEVSDSTEWDQSDQTKQEKLEECILLTPKPKMALSVASAEATDSEQVQPQCMRDNFCMTEDAHIGVTSQPYREFSERLVGAYKNEIAKRKRLNSLIRQQNLCILAQRYNLDYM